MEQTPPHPRGTFCWNELMTTDVERSKVFYTELFGWSVNEAPTAMGTYNLFKLGDREVGGMMQLPDVAQGVPPHWMSYIAVEDVDASAKRAEELGGTIRMPPTDLPGIGRFAILTDPVGATIALLKGSNAPD